MGGALSNAIDRLWLAGVVDFFKPHLLIALAGVFNIADARIVAGVVDPLRSLHRESQWRLRGEGESSCYRIGNSAYKNAFDYWCSTVTASAMSDLVRSGSRPCETTWARPRAPKTTPG